MKTLKEMDALVDAHVAQPLTLEIAKTLKGQKIQTIYYGYEHQDHTDEFVVGEVMSELEYYRNLKEDCYPDKEGHKNRAEYWESFISKERLDDHRKKMILLKEDGTPTYMFCGEHLVYRDIFVCTDVDRIVFYIKADEDSMLQR